MVWNTTNIRIPLPIQMMIMQNLEVGQVWSKNFPPQWQLARQIELLMDLFSDVHKDKFGSGGTAQSDSRQCSWLRFRCIFFRGFLDFVEMHASCELFSVSATLCFLDKKMCERKKKCWRKCALDFSLLFCWFLYKREKCWRQCVFAERLCFFIASYLTDEHLEATKSTKHQAQQVPTYLYEMHGTYNTIEDGAPRAWSAKCMYPFHNNISISCISLL